MNKILLLIFLSISFSLNISYAQNKIDSLEQILVSSKQDTNHVKLLIKISKLYKKTSIDTSLIYCNKALDLAKEIDSKKLIIKSYREIGFIYYAQNNFDKVLESWNNELKVQKEIGHKKAIAKTLGNIGNIYSYQSNFNKSLEYYQESLAIMEEINDSVGIARSSGNIGNIYARQKNYDKAIVYYNKALKIYEAKNAIRGMAINLGNIGNVYTQKKEYKKALIYYEKTVAINKENDDKLATATTLGNIGIIYKSQGDYENAIEYYKQALNIFTETNNKFGTARNLASIASLYNDLGIYRKALENGQKALKIAQEIKIVDLEKQAYSSLSETHKGLGQYKKALEYNNLWITLNDSIYSTEKSKILEEMSARYENEKNEKQIIKQKSDLKNSQLLIAKKQSERNMFIIAFILMIFLALIAFRSYKQKKKANVLLAKQKEEIAEVNEELNQQAEELQLLNENLNQQNEEIRAQRDEIEKQKLIVEEQKDAVEEIHFQLSESITYATQIQESILPESNILDKYLSEHFVLFKPKDNVSGDFYWWTHINNHTIITAVDCTGHGVPGAFMSMLGISFLQEIVEKENITDTSNILQKLRKEIIKALKQTGELGEQKDGMDMAIISINHETNIMQYSGANNPLYIVKSKELKVESKILDVIKEFELNELSTFKLYELRPNKMPIAIYQKMNNFTSHEIQLQKGDTLYLFSDGFADQFSEKDHKKFMYKNFKRLLLENVDKPMTKQKELLDLAFNNWKGNYEQIDDIVVVGIKI